ncbi:MAG: hypothetical protein RL328_562 [Acidobacteriota bacterium]
MNASRFASLGLAFSLSVPAFSQAVPVIFRGKVVMADGSSPGKSVGLQRTCSDQQGTGPGPLTDKEGVFTWRMDVNYMNTRRCYIVATLGGYDSSQVDISSVNPSVSVNVDLPPITLTLKGSDPYQLGGNDIPSKGSGEWSAAMKAVQANNLPEAITHLTAATVTNPKFALAWHNLGVLQDFQTHYDEAAAAYAKAIEANPKMLTAYVALARVQVRKHDWAGVNKTVAAFLPLDKSLIFPEMSLHQAAAHYALKDLAAAEASANAALNPKAKQSARRAEYVLGRILEAKGDQAGAKLHMNRYLELVPTAPDADTIKAHIAQMGQPTAPEPELDNLSK